MKAENIWVHPKFRRQLKKDKLWLEEDIGIKVTNNALSESLADLMEKGLYRDSLVNVIKQKGKRKEKRKTKLIFEL
jgi:hypothetical protein